MAENTIGYIQCPERHCSDIAEVRKAGGKRSSLYTHCPACGTNQGNGPARQKHLTDNLKATREELEKPTVSDTEDTAAVSSKNAASSVSQDVETKPKPDAENKPKAPPILLGVLALAAALITAIFATRKPKGRTA